jgi:hypothetical protein
MREEEELMLGLGSASASVGLKKAKPREDLAAVAGLYPSKTVCEAVTSFSSPL